MNKAKGDRFAGIHACSILTCNFNMFAVKNNTLGNLVIVPDSLWDLKEKWKSLVCLASLCAVIMGGLPPPTASWQAKQDPCLDVI